MGKSRDLIGEKFGRLIVVELHPQRANLGHKRWRCKCDCGNEKVIVGYNLKNGNTKSCGCLQAEVGIKFNSLPEGEASFNYLFGNYKNGAKIRNYPFDLNRDAFRALTNMKCHYCGAEPSSKISASRSNGVYVYNGIDRVENRIGYTVDNCVPCCGYCNKMKGTMTYDEFIRIIKSIHINLNL